MAHNYRRSDGAEAGGLIVSRCRVETGVSGNAVVAAGDVVTNGCSTCPLLAGQRVEPGIGIVLTSRRILHHQRHHCSKRCGSSRRTAYDIESAVLVDEIAIVAGRGERNVGDIALAVGRNPRSCLPRRLGIECARAAAAGPKAARGTFIPSDLRYIA